MPRQALIVFLDGVGVGLSDPARNLFAYGAMPRLAERLGGFPTLNRPTTGLDGLAAAGLDACLGVEGLPQSATGQASLFTGVNAAAVLGHHKGPYPGPRVRGIVQAESVFKKAAAAGASVCLANGYPPEYQEEIGHRKRRHTSTVESTLAAGARIRGLDDLKKGRAVSGSLSNALLREMLGHRDLPLRTPEEAGEILTALATSHDVTVFEYGRTDWVGHRGTREEAVTLLEELDRFLNSVLGTLPPDAPFWLVSDHGNLEDLSTKSHTTNPALFLRRVTGPPPRPQKTLLDFAPDVLAVLGVTSPSPLVGEERDGGRSERIRGLEALPPPLSSPTRGEEARSRPT